MASPLVVLGIDAASPQLLEAWAASGALPNLRALLERSVVTSVQGLDGFYVGSTWPSLVTAVNPARHGVHYLAQVPPGETAYRAVADGAFVKAEPFWSVLSTAGRRVAILDVPLSRLESGLLGIQVVEWGSHDAVFGFRTAPPELADRIVRSVGPHPLGSTCDGRRRTVSDYRSLVGRLVAGAGLKGRLTRELLGGADWDVLVQVFTEAHCVGHQCWHLHDPSHPGHEHRVASELGDPLRAVYGAVDRAIGEILTAAPDATTIVLSAHGMSFAHGAQFLLTDVLVRLGVCRPLVGDDASRGRRALDAARRRASRLPPAVKGPLAAARDRFRPQGSLPSLPSIPVDLAESLCFPVANGLAVGGIRLNLHGREPTGRLRPEEADAFVDGLCADLLALVDERTGAPAVTAVRRTADLYRGENLADLPDLLVEWSDAVPIGSTTVGTGAGATVSLRSPRIGVVSGENAWGRSGEHRRDGIVAVSRPGLRRSALGRPVSLLDVAPTLAALLGVELANVDGAPVAELVTALRSTA